MSIPHQTAPPGRGRPLPRALAALGLSAALLAPAPAFGSTDSPAPEEGSPAGADCVVINEAFPNGGSGSAALSHRFVELLNTCEYAVDLSDWSLQYRARTSTGAPSSTVELSGEIEPGGHYLIQGGGNNGDGAALPTPDAQTGAAIGAAAGGTFILATTSEALEELPLDSVVDHDQVADLLGFGTSNTFETAPATAATNTTSIGRAEGVDTDDNSVDFTRGEPSPTNAAGETLGATEPTDPEPSDPADPEPTDPADPADPEPTDPADPEPTDPETPTEPSELEIAEINAALDSDGEDRPVTTRGVVTAVYPAEQSFNGFYLQTAGSGGDVDLSSHETSEAIFVYSPDAISQELVQIGDFVEITGDAEIYYDAPQISLYPESTQTPHHELALIEDEPFEAVKPASLEVPEDPQQRESLLGMLLDPQGSYTVTDHYTLNQYGEIGIVLGEEPLINPTSAFRPGAEAEALAAENDERVIYLDDAASTSWQAWSDDRDQPLPYLSIEDPIRIGAEVLWQTDVIMDYRFEEWRLQPLSKLTPETAEQVQPAQFENTREGNESPAERAGDVRIAGFNVLNYFVSLGEDEPGCEFYTDIDGNPTTNDYCDARGAYNQASFERQEDKIVTAISGLDADVVALQEIENSRYFVEDGDRDRALAALVEALNGAEGTAGTWDYVESPEEVPADEDVIRNGFIYRTDRVAPEGDSRILFEDGVEDLDQEAFAGLDLEEIFSNAREPLAQEFTAVEGGAQNGGTQEDESFLAIVNHFKSKGGSGTGENADTTGQGSFNGDRVQQARALVAFADALEEEVETEKTFLMGDFNSYEMEDPLQVIAEAGYTNLSAETGGYSYMFDGAVGSLDHLFASEAAVADVVQTEIWNINSVEPLALEYSRYNSVGTLLYSPDQWRSSDHDPILADLVLSGSEAPGDGDQDEEESPEHEAWSSGAVYTHGDTVSHDGGVYRALWYTQNQEPGASPWSAWSQIGAPTACSGETWAQWAPSSQFDGGETVVHDGVRYTAKWHTRNQEPGGRYGPWEESGSC
ncbi:ExeM/NucH family extracellular endonuclease [Nesterenkonia sp. E16_7]|uniref:ExeM/NucH family extracellular endonuclease n=1 Tax=unclassified Nesterenkonia TaxID=2629769 RepID=UPI001A93500D|nr:MULTISPECIES: ExeM/NucH family extracellular endonuclease [unclassified Nesterenkonia]MBO0594098.1 ExeM/NucH family extracellular endonuclease [Nesterenkonia sp. E16_10]MBO0597544.1 ExeM/NucH family extracellular endonuclease [Nesterenkonia sp. E16_7]